MRPGAGRIVWSLLALLAAAVAAGFIGRPSGRRAPAPPAPPQPPPLDSVPHEDQVPAGADSTPTRSGSATASAGPTDANSTFDLDDDDENLWESVDYGELSDLEYEAYTNDQRLRTDPIPADKLTPGTLLAYCTNSGRIGKMQVLEKGDDLVVRCVTYWRGAVFDEHDRFVLKANKYYDLDVADEAEHGRRPPHCDEDVRWRIRAGGGSLVPVGAWPSPTGIALWRADSIAMLEPESAADGRPSRTFPGAAASSQRPSARSDPAPHTASSSFTEGEFVESKPASREEHEFGGGARLTVDGGMATYAHPPDDDGTTVMYHGTEESIKRRAAEDQARRFRRRVIWGTDDEDEIEKRKHESNEIAPGLGDAGEALEKGWEDAGKKLNKELEDMFSGSHD